jgi:hypothetical protein
MITCPSAGIDEIEKNPVSPPIPDWQVPGMIRKAARSRPMKGSKILCMIRGNCVQLFNASCIIDEIHPSGTDKFHKT